MADLSSMVGGATSIERPLTLRGRVVGAPLYHDDVMKVVAINYTSEFSFDLPGTNWVNRGSALPQADDVCLIVFDDDGDAWVPIWQGDTSEDDPGSVDDLTWTHNQVEAASLWTVVHPLPKYPSVTVADNTGVNLVVGFRYISLSTVEITFSEPTSGYAYLN